MNHEDVYLRSRQIDHSEATQKAIAYVAAFLLGVALTLGYQVLWNLLEGASQ